MKKVMKERGHLFIPLMILIYLLFSGKTPIFAAFFAIISTVVIAFLRPTTRIGLSGILNALENGTRSALSVAMACGMVGNYRRCRLLYRIWLKNDECDLSIRSR